MIAEGTTDHNFLGPLLHRAVDDICLREAKGSVIVSDVMRIDVRQRDDEDYFQAAARVARENAGGYHIMFLHRDSGGAGQQARPIVMDRLFSSVAAGVPDRSQVRVVPVQETEAWALADGDALRQVFRVRMSDAELGIPRTPVMVEGVEGPKERLATVYGRTLTPRRRRRDVSAFLPAIALSVEIGRLRAVPAFKAWEQATTDALRSRLSRLSLAPVSPHVRTGAAPSGRSQGEPVPEHPMAPRPSVPPYPADTLPGSAVNTTRRQKQFRARRPAASSCASGDALCSAETPGSLTGPVCPSDPRGPVIAASRP